MLGGVAVGRREAIGNGSEVKVRQTIQRVGTSRFEETPMVVFCVNKSYVKAFMVKEFCGFCNMMGKKIGPAVQ